jgi:hypothetical protein
MKVMLILNVGEATAMASALRRALPQLRLENALSKRDEAALLSAKRKLGHAIAQTEKPSRRPILA